MHHSLSQVFALPLLIVAGATLFIISACGDGEPVVQEIDKFEFPIEVDTKDLEGNAVAGIPVLIDGEVVGFTDADGAFKATLYEKPDTPIRISIDNTDGHRATTDEPHIEENLRVTPSIQGGYNALPVTLRVNFQSLYFEYMAWIEVNCENGLSDEQCQNLPVLVDGDEVARTDSNGYAHFVFTGIPSEQRRISIVTPVHDPDDGDSIQFKPVNPSYEVELRPNPTIFHINEKFVDPEWEPPRSRPRPRPRPRPIPEPQPQEEEEEDDGVLRLF